MKKKKSSSDLHIQIRLQCNFSHQDLRNRSLLCLLLLLGPCRFWKIQKQYLQVRKFFFSLCLLFFASGSATYTSVELEILCWWNLAQCLLSLLLNDIMFHQNTRIRFITLQGMEWPPSWCANSSILGTLVKGDFTSQWRTHTYELPSVAISFIPQRLHLH